MRKLLAILLTLVMAVFLTACGNESSDFPINQEQLSPTVDIAPASPGESKLMDESDPPQSTEGDNTHTGSNILIAYFSRSGNTVWEDGVDAVTSASINVQADGTFAGNAELLAGMAQQTTGGDLFLIQTVDTYPSDYRETTDQAKAEQNANARPALASHVSNMDQYDTIVLIYPNWWGTLPQPVMTFLEEYDFVGKTILPLCTHEGSRMGSSESKIAELCPGVQLLNGLAVRGSDVANAQNDVETWIINSGIME